MLEVRFGVREHYTAQRGLVPDGKVIHGEIVFSLTPEQLQFWAKQAQRVNKPVDFVIKHWDGERV